jgi:hypothetical protein
LRGATYRLIRAVYRRALGKIATLRGQDRGEFGAGYVVAMPKIKATARPLERL